jgi:CHAT domain-containing protein/tetratricopeptide (TPR) repeat protein
MLEGDRIAAIAEYERILADIEAGAAFFGEAELRSDFARLLHDMADPRETTQLTKAAGLFQQRGDTEQLIDACLRLSQLHRQSSSVALYWVDRAIATAERGGNPQDLSQPLALRGELLLAFGRVEEALVTLERAVRLPGGHAYVGALATAQILVGQTDAGLHTLSESLAEAERESGGEASRRVVTLTIRLADARSGLGDRAAALELLEAAAVRAEQLDDGLFLTVMDRLGSTRLESGDPSGAVRALEAGIERARAAPRAEAAAFTSLYNNLGNALAAVGNQTGAFRSFSEAIRRAHDDGNLRSEALSHFGLANVLARFDEGTQAKHSYDEARALAVRLGDQSLEAACLDSLGQLHLRAGEAGKAVDLHTRAAQLHNAVEDYEHQHVDLMNLVQSLLVLRETAAARRALDEARELGAAHLLRLPWQHALNEGQVLAREGRWPLARASFDTAITRLEAERVTLGTPDDQRRWAARCVEAFEIAAAAAFEAGDALNALSYLEGNRARFLDAVAERRRRMPPGLSPETRRRYEVATNDLSELRWLRRQQPEVVDPQLEAELAEATRSWQELSDEVERLRIAHGGSVERVQAPAPARLAESLAAGEVAVALHIAVDWLGVACIGRRSDGSLWWECATDPRCTLAHISRAVVGRAVGDQATIRPAWQDLGGLPRAEAEQLVASTCAMLADLVWPLVESVVQHRADALVLMPGRGLNVLPLHAAVTSDGRLAMDRWSVRYAPSLNLFARAGSAGLLPAARTLAQVVNPTGDLPFADTEAAALRRIWTAAAREPLRGAEATPDRVLNCFEQADVLHFAGHGAFDPEDPLQSRLFCAPGASGGTITLQTLLESVPAARTRVILLSACETGRVVAGDPLNDQLGLPGGMLIGGAAAVLATFWRVDDLATCLLLVHCGELWERGSTDLERALAGAQEWLRSRATVRVVREWIEDRLDEEHSPELELAHGRLVVRDDDELLFASARYWAPFHVTGRAVRVADSAQHRPGG